MEIRVTSRRTGRVLESTDIRHDLQGVRFPDHEDWVNIFAVTLTDVDFSRERLRPLNIIGTQIRNGRFDRAQIPTGSFGSIRAEDRQARLIDCTFDRTRFGVSVRVQNVRFERCTFTDVKIRHWRAFHAVEFIDCTFTGELRDCWFAGSTPPAEVRPGYASLPVNEFRGNDFSGARLIDCWFDHGIDLFAQKWPNDPDYLVLDRFRARVRAARAAIARWPDDMSREAALGCLNILDRDGVRQTDQVFVRRDEWLDWLPDVRDELFRSLEADPGPSAP